MQQIAECSQAMKRTAQRAFTAINNRLATPLGWIVEYDSEN
jgi:hypothetical protein